MAFKLAEAFVQYKQRGLGQVQSAAKKATSALSSTLGISTALTGGLTALTGGFAISSMVKFAASTETTREQLKTFLGTAERAQDFMTQTRESDAATIFGTKKITDMSRNLLALGIAAGDVQDDIAALGNISAASGAQLESVALAFSQTKGKGILLGDDLRQMQNQGIPILQILADHMGVATTEIRDLASKGKISFETVRGAMRKAGSESGKFAGAMARMGKTTQGQFATLMSKTKTLAMKMGTALLPVVNKIVKSILNIVDTATWVWENWGTIWDLMVEYTKLKISNGLEHVKTFGDNIVEIFMWIGENWNTIWTNMFEAWSTALLNHADNIKNVFEETWKFVKSGGKSGGNYELKNLFEGAKFKSLDGPELSSANTKESNAKIDALLQTLGKSENKDKGTDFSKERDAETNAVAKGVEKGTKSAQAFSFDQLGKKLQNTALAKAAKATKEILTKHAKKADDNAGKALVEQKKLTKLSQETMVASKKSAEVLTNTFGTRSFIDQFRLP